MRALNVLLVDDEAPFRETLIKRLKRRGVDATGAGDGPRALELLDSQSFDAVVLDMKMPGMDGLEALRRIREHHPEVEVVLLTGHVDRGAAVRAMNLGAFDFMLKPIGIDELLCTIEQACRKARKCAEPQISEKDNSGGP